MTKKERDLANTRRWLAKPGNKERMKAYRIAHQGTQEHRDWRGRYEAKNADKLLNQKRERYNPAAARAWHLWAKYRITVVQWLALFKMQGERCACCGAQKPGSRYGWHTDHDNTKQPLDGEPHIVRGIVCHHCNIMLGAARDNAVILMKGRWYLERR